MPRNPGLRILSEGPEDADSQDAEMRNGGLEDEMSRYAELQTQEIFDEMAGFKVKSMRLIDVPYCICRKGADGWMIGCDAGCDDWFHGSCVALKRGRQCPH